MELRQERLGKVLEFINNHSDNEVYFSALYKKLLEEVDLEMHYNSDMVTNQYLNNLRQTRDKQADAYQQTKTKRQKRGASSEFRDFVSNFRNDLEEAIHQ